MKLSENDHRGKSWVGARGPVKGKAPPGWWWNQDGTVRAAGCGWIHKLKVCLSHPTYWGSVSYGAVAGTLVWFPCCLFLHKPGGPDPASSLEKKKGCPVVTSKIVLRVYGNFHPPSMEVGSTKSFWGSPVCKMFLEPFWNIVRPIFIGRKPWTL